MAYSPPKQWNHGDIVTATELQKYSDGLNAINAVLSTVGYRNYGTPFSTFDDNQIYYVVHSKRYLIYWSSGQIVDLSGVNENVELPNDSEFEYNVYDLDSIDWLDYGELYQILGCSVVFEDTVGVVHA